MSALPVTSQQHDGDNDLQQHFGNLVNYSHDMTQALFANQTFSVPTYQQLYATTGQANSETVQDNNKSNQRHEKLLSIKEKQMFGALIDEGAKSTHPLALNSSLVFKPSNISSTNNEPSNQTTPNKDNNNSKKSARSLVAPYMNAIDKKKQALDVMVQPENHQPWKLYRVISGSGGWIHCIAVEPANMWFASGAGDGLIKIWDLASGKLRITLTGHISGVRGLSISKRRPYMFSCAEDKTVKCWDLEQNQIVRHYHGHLSGVYCVALHPQDDLLITGGRDSVARLWDVRTKEQVTCLTGHTNTVAAVLCQKYKPHFITGSHDSTIRLWDMRDTSKALLTLTHHRKAIRALSFDHTNQGFMSGAIDNIKQWDLPEGRFVQNFSGHNAIINALATNQDNVVVSGGDDGTLYFWDWRTGYNFQKIRCPPQPGSIDSEAGILAVAFDRSGTRMITGESDKTIKMFREQ